MAVKTDPTESLRRVPLFAGLDRKELEMLGKLIKEQRYAAGATIVALPVVVLYFFLQRHFISGMLSGAVKE